MVGITSTMLVLYASVFLDMLGFGIAIPLLPFLAMHFGAGTYALAMMTVSFSFMQMLGNMVLGRTSDKFGRKLTVCACLLGSAVSYAAFASAGNITMLIAFRGLSGFFSGTIGCTQAYICASVSEKERMAALGHIGALLTGGIALGPGFSAALSNFFNFQECFQITAFICLLNCIAGVIFLEEPQVKQETLLSSLQNPAQVATIGPSVWERPQCFLIFFSTAAYYAAFSAWEAMGALFFHAFYGMSAAGFGSLVSLSGCVSLVLQLFFVKRVIERLGEAQAGILSHMSRICAYVLIAACHTQLAPYLTALLVPGGSFLSASSASMLATLMPHSKGIVLGMNQSFAAFGRFIGPLAAAWVYKRCPTGIWWMAVLWSMLGVCLLACVRTKTTEVDIDDQDSLVSNISNADIGFLSPVGSDGQIPILIQLHVLEKTHSGRRPLASLSIESAMFPESAYVGKKVGACKDLPVASASIATALYPSLSGRSVFPGEYLQVNPYSK